MVLILLTDDWTSIVIPFDRSTVYSRSDSVSIRVEAFRISTSREAVLFCHPRSIRIVSDPDTVRTIMIILSRHAPVAIDVFFRLPLLVVR